MAYTRTAMLRDENLAQVLSCFAEFSHFHFLSFFVLRRDIHTEHFGFGDFEIKYSV
jgi:hypothetical protein